MIMKVIYVKFMVAKIQSFYCPITRWENYAMLPIVSFFINFELFFLSLACNRNRSRSSSTRKTKSYRLKNEDDDDLSENSSSVVVSVESLVRFYVMAKSRPPTEKVLYFVSSIWGDALSIFSDFNARQQHNLPVKVLCNCGWRERDSPHPEIDAASRLEIRICSDIYKKKMLGQNRTTLDFSVQNSLLWRFW